MVKLINESSLINLETLENSKTEYYILGRMIAITDMNESTAEDLISKIDSGEFDNCQLLAFYLYDLYFDSEKMNIGFTKFFKHLIFRNQWFLNHNITIFCISEEMKLSIRNTILNTQRIITKTKKLWPTDDELFIDVVDMTTSTEGTIGLLSESKSPFYTVKYNTSAISKTKSNYYEIQESIDTYNSTEKKPTKKINSTDDNYSKSLENFNLEDKSENEEITYKLYKIKKFKCYRITMKTSLEISKFYGAGLSKLDIKPDKNLEIIIYESDKIEEKFLIYLSDNMKDQLKEFLYNRKDFLKI